jgi:hypothetical protein
MAVNPLTLLDGTTAYAHDVEDKVNPLYTDIDNTNIRAAAGILWSKSEALTENYILVGNASNVATPTAPSSVSFLAPIETILAYCDGSTKTIAGIGAQTLPDLSNRYMVGFGTEGGGDIDTAAWSTTPVGNASHQVNLQHSHTVDSHTHDTNISHGHSDNITAKSRGHYHNVNAGIGSTLTAGSAGAHTHKVYLSINDGSGAWWDFETDSFDPNAGTTVDVDYIWFGNATTDGAHTHNVTGTVGQPSTGNDGDVDGITCQMSGSVANYSGSKTSGGASASTMNNQLSTTQSIQPRSIKVRYIMRIA